MELTFTISPAPAQALDGEGLAPLEWAGLCARLAAAQDLRREFDRGARSARAGAAASFSPSPARLLLGSARLAPAVNHEPLADGKARGGIANGPDDIESARECRDRGQQ